MPVIFNPKSAKCVYYNLHLLSILVCQPSGILVKISSDVEIGFQFSEAIECINWINETNLYFFLIDGFDESRYFWTGKFVSSGIVHLTLTVKIGIKKLGSRKVNIQTFSVFPLIFSTLYTSLPHHLIRYAHQSH